MPRRYWILFCVIGLGSVGCSSRQGARVERVGLETDPEVRRAALRERADEYWNAKLRENCERLFGFFEPALQAEYKKEEFVEWCKDQEPFIVQSFRLGQVQVEGPIGWTEVDYTAALRRFPDLDPRDAKQWQKWRLINDNWYPVPPHKLNEYPAAPALRDLEAERDLRARFDLSWQARVKRDWEALYDLTDPKDREKVSFDEYSEVESLFYYLDRRIHWVEALEENGTVLVTYHHKVADSSMEKLPARDLTIQERWVKHDGEWYRDLVRP